MILSPRGKTATQNTFVWRKNRAVMPTRSIVTNDAPLATLVDCHLFVWEGVVGSRQAWGMYPRSTAAGKY